MQTQTATFREMMDLIFCCNSEPLPAEIPATTVGPTRVPTVDAAAESELIARVCSGETEVFCELMRPYERTIYFAAFSILNNQADAAETAQEVVLKVFRGLKGFRGESRFITWVIQITVNEARLRVRKDRRRLFESIDEQRETDDGEYTPRDFADWREIPSESLQRMELREALTRAIVSLAPKYRQVFIMRDISQINIQETAKALGITEASVKTRLLRARLQMRDALAPGIDGAWNMSHCEYKGVQPW